MANNSALSLPDYSAVYKQMQKEANDTAIKVQKMADATSAKTFEYNTQEAEKSRTWQEKMSSSAHQREVKDLVKAGLNPVLSAGGNGAQSYTTSSASAEAENPASAVAQIEAAKMNNFSSMYGSNIQAQASRNAAMVSARATLAAAQQQAEASKYAADSNYKLGVYKANLDYQARKYAADKAYQAVLDKPVSNPFGLLDKYIGNSVGESLVDKVKGSVSKLLRNPKNFFSGTHNSKDSFKLVGNGFKVVKDGLGALNIPKTDKNANTFVKGYVFGDNDAAYEISRIAKYYNGKDSKGRRYTDYGAYDPDSVYDFDI